MKKIINKIVSGIMVTCMTASSLLCPVGAANIETRDLSETLNYNWINNEKNIEYPTNKTQIEASNAQGGYGAERLLDGNNNTRWEASWNNAPEKIDIIFTTEKEEHITGVQYVSRLDNNIGGVMTDYEIYISTDGNTYLEEPVKIGSLTKKLGTFYIVFEEPVEAKKVKITSNVKAASEMRIMYIPSSAQDYDSLMAEAEDDRAIAGETTGMDNGLWTPDSLQAFDEGMAVVKEVEKPTDEEALYNVNKQIYELIRDLQRAQLKSTNELNGQLRLSEVLLNSATVGTKPLTWAQEDINVFENIVTSAQEVAGSQVAQKGKVMDAALELQEGEYLFKQAQKKPNLMYTGTILQPLEHVLDGLTESHFQGRGVGETTYFELDYDSLVQFESLGMKTWWATGQCIKKIKVEYKNEDGIWSWVDNQKIYEMNWETNTSVSESQRVTFDESVKGSAIRIYVLEAVQPYVIDELEVGISIDVDDVQIYLDKEELELQEGESAKLEATILPASVANKEVVWTSSNDSVVSVKQDGTITVVGIPEGKDSEEVTITATSTYANKQATCKVTAHVKWADDEEKQEVLIRLKNAKKLMDASKPEDYKEHAIDSLREALLAAEEKVQGDVTVGGLAAINNEIKEAVKLFEEASFIPIIETRNLIERITGEHSSNKFIIETIPADEATKMDVYEVDWDDTAKKVVLRGNNGVALATAYNYYLKYFAYLDFPYVGESDLILPTELPKVDKKVRIVFPYEYRHYFNENCEYKYTTSLYGEAQWQHRIDWMAMNGFNMFLVDIGEHAIWYNAEEKLGLDENALEELRHSNKGTEQYYGKYGLSQAAVEKEGALAKKVVTMGLKLGMEPEIRPFVGQVPFMFANNREEYYGEKSVSKIVVDQPGSIFDGMFLYSAARWMNLPQGVFISPSVESSDSAKAEEMSQKFTQISDIYYESLMETLGFNEFGRTPKYGYKDLIGEQGFVVSHAAFPRSVLKVMNDELLKLNPDAIWMQTSWRYQSWLTQYYKPGHLMFVDLSADNRPKWNTNNEFGGTQWLWSMLYNFGGNTGMGGGFDKIANDVIDASENSNYMKGVSISPEGGDTNPALYALMAEMTWRSEKPDLNIWIKEYAKRRYGAENYGLAKEDIDQAWSTLYHTVYRDFVSGDGPAQTLINALPKLSGAISRVYGSNEKVYDTQDLLPAWEYMLEAAKKMKNPTPQFLYDLVDITRQAIGDLSGEVYSNIKPNYDEGNKEKTLKYADLMIQLCNDMDEILATNTEFMLGTRLDRAKNRGVTTEDQKYFEKVERTFATYWVLDTPDAGGGLLDYCNRHLSGLMTDYYGMRWTSFRKYLEEAMDEGMTATQFNSTQQAKINAEIRTKMVAFTEDTTPYATKAMGDTVDISSQLWNKYQTLIKELYGAADASRDLPIGDMSVTAGNQQSDQGAEGPASNVLDADINTMWHTAWGGSERNVQYLIINLNGKKEVGGLRYLPRQSGGVNGIITEYAIDVSNDNGLTYKEVATGTWDGNTIWKEVSFKGQMATHVKLRVVNALSTTGLKFASAAEIRITKPIEEPPVVIVDKEVLKAKIAEAETKVEEEYTKESWDTLQNALESAKEVLKKTDATQVEVNEVLDILNKAIEGLEEIPPVVIVDKKVLKAKIAEAETKVEEEYTKESWDTLQNALESAKEVLKKTDATQVEVNEVLDIINKAIEGLEEIPPVIIVDKEVLKAKIAEAETKVEKEYTKESWIQFKNVLATAKKVVENASAIQEEVDNVILQLEKAIKELVKNPIIPTYKQGWKHNSKGWWYQYSDGTWPANKWVKISSKWYHFNLAGYMQTGWLKDGKVWYYLKSSGAMATGWTKVNTKWYYLKENGKMATGWVKDAGKWYYLATNGKMAIGWVKDAGEWYYLASNGKMATDWVKHAGKWYYMDTNGKMKTGWVFDGKRTYYLNKTTGAWNGQVK